MSLVDNAKIIADLVKKGVTIDLEEKIMSLRQEALEMQEENVELKIKNLELRKKIDDLKQNIKDNDHFVYENHYYWRLTDDGKDGPYCQKCYEDKQKKVHLIRSGTACFCSVCNFNSLDY